MLLHFQPHPYMAKETHKILLQIEDMGLLYIVTFISKTRGVAFRSQFS